MHNFIHNLFQRAWLHGFMLCTLFVLSACGSATAPGDRATAAQQERTQAPPSAEGGTPVPVRAPLVLPSVAALPAGPEQQRAMQQPQSAAQLWADLLRQGRYAEIEPLLSDSLRQAFLVQQPGSVAAFYARQAEEYGALSAARVLGVRTPFDTDTLVVVDVDLTYAQQTIANELDLVQTAAGWKIDNFGARPEQPMPSISVSDDLRATLQDPEQVARFYADALMGNRYDQLEPIFTYYARSTLAGSGGVAAQHRMEAQQRGPLSRYTIVQASAQPNDFYDVNIDLYYELRTLRLKIVLNKTPQGWKINHIVPRQ